MPPTRRGAGGWAERGPPPPRRPAPSLPPLPPLPPGTAEYFATCHPGNEAHLAAELAGPRIKASHVRPGKAGVAFTSPPGEAGSAVMHRANLWSRVGIRVLHVLGRGSIAPSRYGTDEGGGREGGRGGDRLYLWARRAVDWPSLLPRGGTLNVDARLSGGASDLATPALAAARVRDAACDAVRDATGARPPPPPPPPPGTPLAASVDLPLLIAVDGGDAVTLYRDTSGASLHKRGYRAGGAVHAASLNEAAAAGVLAAAGWGAAAAAAGRGGASGGDPSAAAAPPLILADPMCGSGTLLIEAALAACQAAPGLFRTAPWPFERWPDHDGRGWAAAKGAAARARVAWQGGALLGNDLERRALDLAVRDAGRAGVAHMIEWSCGPASAWTPPVRPTLVITNPPWGRRLGGTGADGRSVRLSSSPRRPSSAAYQEEGELDWDGDGGSGGGAEAAESAGEEDLAAAWADLGAFLRAAASPCTAWVVCGNPAASRSLRMRAATRAPLGIGGADARLLRYEVLPPLPAGGIPLGERGVRGRAGGVRAAVEE